MEELVQHEKAPNLYWALTALPDRLIDLQSLVDWERRKALLHIPEVANLDRERSEAQWRDIRLHLGLGRQTSFLLGVPGLSKSKLQQRYQEFVARARRELPALRTNPRESGPASASVGDMENLPTHALQAVVDKLAIAARAVVLAVFNVSEIDFMSDEEVAVRYFVARYPIASDKYVRALLFPPPTGLPLFREAQKQLDEEAPAITKSISALRAVYLRVWMQRRRIDALRIIEALRNYAARHEGELPSTLAEIEDMPIPADVLTGESFQYRREGDVAYLSAEEVELYGEEENGIWYRIRAR